MVYSSLATPSATRTVMAAHGLATKKRLGQHFLVDDNVVGKILKLADIEPSQTILEVGPGIGTLTVALCERAGHVVAIERDPALVPALEESTARCGRFALIRADALDVDAREICGPFGPPDALVANLPYSVAATVVLRFFEMLSTLSSAVVMVQAEVADRITAEPGTKAYGAYTVKLRLLTRTVARFAVARSCFMPPPRVDSSVLRLERAPLVHDACELSLAFAAADAAFAQRRKTIRNSLKSALSADPLTLDAALDEAGIDGDERAERLEPTAFVALAFCLNKAGILRTSRDNRPSIRD